MYSSCNLLPPYLLNKIKKHYQWPSELLSVYLGISQGWCNFLRIKYNRGDNTLRTRCHLNFTAKDNKKREFNEEGKNVVDFSDNSFAVPTLFFLFQNHWFLILCNIDVFGCICLFFWNKMLYLWIYGLKICLIEKYI